VSIDSEQVFEDNGAMGAALLDGMGDDRSSLLRWVEQHRRIIQHSEAETLA
jgi:hypothetical protein